MSIWTNGLPNTVTVDGKPFKIKTDFRNWIKFGELLKIDVDIKYKATVALDIFVGEKPENNMYAFEALLMFSMCGRTPNTGISTGEPDFDLEQDWEYIYASFKQMYSIDLFRDTLHYWAFTALLGGLRECKMTDIIELRNLDLSDYKDPKTKSKLRRAKRAVALRSMDGEFDME